MTQVQCIFHQNPIPESWIVPDQIQSSGFWYVALVLEQDRMPVHLSQSARESVLDKLLRVVSEQQQTLPRGHCLRVREGPASGTLLASYSLHVPIALHCRRITMPRN